MNQQNIFETWQSGDMTWRALVTSSPGHHFIAHNRWLTNWVARRQAISSSATTFRIVRLATKRIVFEIPKTEATKSKTKGMFIIALSVVTSLSLTACIVLAQTKANSDAKKIDLVDTDGAKSTCFDLADMHPSVLVQDFAAFEYRGWQFKPQTKLIQLGQLASAEYVATCKDEVRDFRVQLLRQGESWLTEKMAPTQ